MSTPALQEVMVILWAGVPAKDNFVARPVELILPNAAPGVAYAPIGFSLMPLGAKYSTMDQYEWQVRNIIYSLVDEALHSEGIPLSDMPYVIKYVSRVEDY